MENKQPVKSSRGGGGLSGGDRDGFFENFLYMDVLSEF